MRTLERREREAATARRPHSRPRQAAVTVVVIAVLAAVLTATLSLGDRTTTTSPAGGDRFPQVDTATRFLLAVALIMLTARMLGMLATRLGQPAVLGDIVAGLVLGPAVLGVVAPQARAWVFTEPVSDAVAMAAQLGLVAFMVLLGSEVRVGSFASAEERTRRTPGLGRSSLGHTAFGLTSGTVVAATLLSLPLAAVLFARHAGPGVSFGPFAVFLALAVSITALPVLGRILEDRRLTATPVGALVLTTALVGDLFAWVLLAVVLATSGTGTAAAAVTSLALTAIFAVVVWVGLRPALDALAKRLPAGPTGDGTLLAVLLGGGLVSAVLTQLIGVHAVIGAFAFGLAVPRDSVAVERCAERLRGVTTIVLLPLFFAEVGMRITFTGGGTGSHAVGVLGLVLVVAVAAKFAGVMPVALLMGVPRREAWSVAALLNCRGVTEVIVASVAYQNGIIDGFLFSVLTLMALLTTGFTAPLLDIAARLGRGRP